MRIGNKNGFRNIKPIAKRIISANTIAIVIVFLFLFANTFKVALFNKELTDTSATLSFSLANSGFFIKFLLNCFLFVLLLRWKRPFLFIIFYVFQSIYMYANLSYHYYFEGYLHINQYIGLFSEAFELFKHAALPQNTFYWLLLMDVPLFIGILFMYSKVAFLNKHSIRYKAFFALSAVLVLFLFKAESVDSVAKPLTIMDDSYSSDNAIVQKYGLLAYNIADMLKYRDTRCRINSLNYGQEIGAGATDSAYPNVIVIQVESMDSYIINFKHKNAYVMPYLHSLCQKSVFYPFVLSYHKAGSTSDCEFSIINSVEPFDDYPAIKIRNYDYPNSMLKPFHAARYDVLAFHGNRGTYFNRNSALKKMGFQTFYDMLAMGLEEKGWGASDGDVFDFVKNKLRDQKGPFFYYVITMTSHEPFIFAKLYYATDAFNDIGDAIAKNYFTSMSYVDDQIKRFIGHVRDKFPNTYFYIYGDHSPPIVENSVYKRAAFTDDGNLFEFVPLLILTPDETIYQERNQIASFLDLAPTVLPAAKIAFKIKSNGTNLFSYSCNKDAIPYKGETYSRADLFKKMRSGNKPGSTNVGVGLQAAR
jgi:lipoteichoic acid synthase